MSHWLTELNVVAECKHERLPLLQCPPFLVPLWGIITITTLLTTYLVASRFASEEVVIVSAVLITMISLAIGALIITGFNKIAEADRMKSEFISIASHQLRSPLSIFKWTIDLIERDLAHNSIKEVTSSLETLRASTESMIQIVNSLLGISRIEAGTLVLKKTPLALDEITRNIIAGVKRFAEASQVTFALNSPQGIARAMGDPEQIGIVVYNLIDNAIRYSPRGGTITISLVPEDAMIKWLIQDQGIGIPATEQRYVFQKFFRANSELKNQTKGTGIGLYIAKAVIDASGGAIGFASADHSGSKFWFTLPRA